MTTSQDDDRQPDQPDQDAEPPTPDGQQPAYVGTDDTTPGSDPDPAPDAEIDPAADQV